MVLKFSGNEASYYLNSMFTSFLKQQFQFLAKILTEILIGISPLTINDKE